MKSTDLSTTVRYAQQLADEHAKASGDYLRAVGLYATLLPYSEAWYGGPDVIEDFRIRTRELSQELERTIRQLKDAGLNDKVALIWRGHVRALQLAKAEARFKVGFMVQEYGTDGGNVGPVPKRVKRYWLDLAETCPRTK